MGLCERDAVADDMMRGTEVHSLGDLSCYLTEASWPAKRGATTKIMEVSVACTCHPVQGKLSYGHCVFKF